MFRPPPLPSLVLLALVAVPPAVGSTLHGVSIVPASSIERIIGHPRQVVMMWAEVDGEPRPIPFQTDERDHRDRWVVGPEPGPTPDAPKGRFDDNDTIVFMNRDLGPRIDPEALPTPGDWYEARVGTEEAPLGFAYVRVEREAETVRTGAPVDYVLKPEGIDGVRTDRFMTAFDGPFPSRVHVVSASGDEGPNILQGLHAEGVARILKGLITIERGHDDIGVNVSGWKDGPVRAIRRSKYWIELPLGFKARANVSMLFHSDFVEAQTTARVDIPPKLIPASGDLTAAFRLLESAGAGALLVDGGVGRAPVVSEANLSDLSGRPARWAAIALGSGHAMLVAVRVEGSLRNLDRRTWIRNGGAPPSLDRFPTFGFQLGGFERLETGDHDLAVIVALIDSVDPAEVSSAAETFLAPPAVSVRKLDGPRPGADQPPVGEGS